MTPQKLANAADHSNFSPESKFLDTDQHTTQISEQLPSTKMEGGNKSTLDLDRMLAALPLLQEWSEPQSCFSCVSFFQVQQSSVEPGILSSFKINIFIMTLCAPHRSYCCWHTQRAESLQSSFPAVQSNWPQNICIAGSVGSSEASWIVSRIMGSLKFQS